MKYFVTGTIASLLITTAMPVLADCAPDSIGRGDTAICDGLDADGFKDGSKEITVIVNTGAVVNSSAGSNNDAINVDDDDTIVENNGTLNGADDGVQGGDGFLLTNTGTIIAGDDGVNVQGRSGVKVTNTATGEIKSVDRGIHMDADGGSGGDNNTVENAGLIASSGGEGIEAGDSATITNAVTGIIRGYDDAVQVGENAMITNFGLIESTGIPGDGQDAIDIDSGTIENKLSGRILSALDAAIDFDESTIQSTIINDGLIEGEMGIIVETNPAEANTAVQEIINTGTITGRSGPALLLGAGEDIVQNYGTIMGSGAFGDDNDTFEIYGQGYAGAFGGAGAIFDGGDGFDAFSLIDILFSSVNTVSLITDGFSLNVANDQGGSFDIALTNWEQFGFAGSRGPEVYTVADLADFVPSPIPLPATALMMLTALGGIAALRRK